MGCADVFCTLCGGPLNRSDLWDSLRSPDPEPGGAYWDYNRELLSEEDTEWLYDVRAIAEWQSKADREKHHPVAAETYYSSEFDSCAGLLEATDKNGVTHWYGAFEPGYNEGYYPHSVHYIMHSACLVIVKRWMFEAGKSTQDLYNALRVYEPPFLDFRGVFLPNGHYGAEQFWEQFWEAKQRWEFLVKDPVNIPGMTEYILSKLLAVPPETEAEGRLHTTTSDANDTSDSAIDHSCVGPDLQRLPVEIIQRICVYLPLTTTLALRLSCRDLRQRIATDQHFYRRQLLSGHLFALTDLDLGLIQQRWEEIKDKDWRQLVRDLTRYENYYAGERGSGAPGKLHDAPIGLKNRMRIVKIVVGIFSGT